MKRILLLAVLTLAGHAALAAKVPQPTAADQRIRQVLYSPNEVYEVTGSYRYTTTIEFEKGETVQYLTLGGHDRLAGAPDGTPGASEAGGAARGHEPDGSDRPPHVLLPACRRGVQRSARRDLPAAIHLSVRRGHRDQSRRGAKGRRREGAKALAGAGKVRHCNYSVFGSPGIKLLRACDDGVFTFLEFADKAPLPAFFAVDADGNESVVNFRMEGKYVVIERVGSVFTLREGKEALCLFNDDKPLPRDNALPRTSLHHGASS